MTPRRSTPWAARPPATWARAEWAPTRRGWAAWVGRWRVTPPGWVPAGWVRRVIPRRREPPERARAGGKVGISRDRRKRHEARTDRGAGAGGAGRHQRMWW